MSPRSTNLDPGFLAMSGLHSNPYHDERFISAPPMSPATAWPEPLSPCLLAEPTLIVDNEPVTKVESFEVKSAAEFLSQGIPSAYPSTSAALPQGNVGYPQYSTTTVPFVYPSSTTLDTQASWAMAGPVTTGAANLAPTSIEGLITTSLAGNGAPVGGNGTSGYPVYTSFPATYPQFQPPAYGSAGYGTVYHNLGTSYGAMGAQMSPPKQFTVSGEQTTLIPGPASYVPPSTLLAPAMPNPGMPPSSTGTASMGAPSTMPSTPDCSLHHQHVPGSAMTPPGPPAKSAPHRRRAISYRFVTFPQGSGATSSAGGSQDSTTSPGSVEGDQGSPTGGTTTNDSDSEGSSPSSPSAAALDRQKVLDSIPPLKLQAMRQVPVPAEGDNLAKDRYIVKGKSLKLSYGQIKAIAGWTDAESTLRGRYRNFTKAKHERLRKPRWTLVDLFLLQQAVVDHATNILNNSPPRRAPNGEVYHHEPGFEYSVATLPVGIESNISWKAVSDWIVNHGGTYRFGASTTKRQWFALTQRPRQI